MSSSSSSSSRIEEQSQVNRLTEDQLTAPMKSQLSRRLLGPVEQLGQLNLPGGAGTSFKPSFPAGSKESLIHNEMNFAEKSELMDRAYKESSAGSGR